MTNLEPYEAIDALETGLKKSGVEDEIPMERKEGRRPDMYTPPPWHVRGMDRA